MAELASASWLARASVAVLRRYVRLYHRYRIVGAEHLPPEPPVLALTNHVSLLDVPAFGLASPYRLDRQALVVKGSLMKVPLVAQVLRSWGAIAVDRDGRDAGALRQVLERLRDGYLVALAVEGTRNRAGRLGEVNPVLARLAITTDAPLVPVAALGTYDALPPGAWIPRPRRIGIAIGPTFNLHHLRARPKGEAIEAARAEIRARIASLLPAAAREREAVRA
jgi:1-acyl-sn-glycerol-3-phosphate acyltransferase